MALNYDALTALTQKKYVPKIIDNFFESNPLLVYLKDRQKTFPGGHKIVEPLIYGNIEGVKSYSMYDTITYDTNIPISAAEFQPKNVVAPIIISKDEELQNAGETQVLQLLKSKIQIVEETLKSSVTSMLYGDGTGNGGKDITGLGAAIATTGVYGGIDSVERSNLEVSVLMDSPIQVLSVEEIHNSLWAVRVSHNRFTHELKSLESIVCHLLTHSCVDCYLRLNKFEVLMPCCHTTEYQVWLVVPV
jgi:hypothetical protein